MLSVGLGEVRLLYNNEVVRDGAWEEIGLGGVDRMKDESGWCHEEGTFTCGYKKKQFLPSIPAD